MERFKSKKGEIPLSAFISIVLISLAILAAISILLKSADAKSYFCRTTEKIGFLGRFSSFRKYCSGTDFEFEELRKKDFVITEFSGGERTKGILLTKDNKFTQTASILIPDNSEISKISFQVESPDIWKADSFFWENKKVADATLNLEPEKRESIIIQLPKEAFVTDSNISIVREDLPSVVDIAFILDTSGSMSDEWNSLCAATEEIAAYFKNLGVNVTSSIYGLDSGGTGSCKGKIDISTEALQKVASENNIIIRPMPSPDLWTSVSSFGTSPEGFPKVIETEPYDQYDEAWAVGIIWAIKNHEWRNNSKRVIFGISDSDPTGAGKIRKELRPSPLNPSGVYVGIGDAEFSGSEEVSVIALRSSAGRNFKTFIICGNEDQSNPDNVEGFGLNSCICNDDDSKCKRLVMMMDRASSNGKALGFSDKEKLNTDVINAIRNTPPNRVIVKIGNEYIVRELNAYNIKNFNVQSQAFSAAINRFLQESCRTESCDIPISFSSDEVSSLKISGLHVAYRIKAKGITIKHNGISVFGPQEVHEQLKVDVDVNPEEANVLKNCEENCNITLIFSSGNNVLLKISNLSASGKSYFFDDALIEKAVICLSQASLMNYQKKLICSELKIPKGHEGISEEVFTKRLISRDMCALLPNNNINGNHVACGNSDKVDFANNLKRGSVVIKYDPSIEKVVIE